MVGRGVLAVGETETLARSVSDRSAMDEERSEKRAFLTVVLPALLRSLSGGVCRRVTCWGRAGTVAVEVLVLCAGILGWDRSFMVPRGEEVADLTHLSAELSRLHGVERENSYYE